MNYKEARDYIAKVSRRGMTPGLDAVRELLRRVGNPQERLPFVHVAGTNGKGSAAAFISSVLAEGGLRVGRYISPAVFTYRERIQIQDRSGSRCIGREAVAGWLGGLKRASEEMEAAGLPCPTAFELETAMAFLEFAGRECDIAVLETGMGGRLDATNVIGHPVCSVLTSIGYDHMQYLGDTLEKITEEKAGIIKKGCPVVSYDQAYETGAGRGTPEAVIKEACRRMDAELYTADFSRLSNIRRGLSGTRFDYKEYRDLEIPLLGEFQTRNAATALEAVRVLSMAGYPVTEKTVRRGFKNTKWRGRFDLVSQKPLVIADGAHNEAAAAALAGTVRQVLKNRRIILVMGIFADKDYRAVLKHMLPMGSLLITVTPDHPRGLDSRRLSEAAGEEAGQLGLSEGKPEIVDGGTVEKGLLLAEKKRDKNSIVLAFGSLSLLPGVYAFYGEQPGKGAACDPACNVI